jgi:hypothetical protein
MIMIMIIIIIIIATPFIVYHVTSSRCKRLSKTKFMVGPILITPSRKRYTYEYTQVHGRKRKNLITNIINYKPHSKYIPSLRKSHITHNKGARYSFRMLMI